MSRSSRASDAAGLAFALVLTGCSASTTALPGATTDPDEDARRHPDGVAIDPASAPPPARNRAKAGEGLVTLRTPLGVDRAVATVDQLFKKIVREDTEGLDALFTRDAHVLTTAGGSAPAQMTTPPFWWEQRFRRLDYTRLAGELVYRPGEIDIYRGEDLEGAAAFPGAPPQRGEPLAETDVVIRVPIVTPRIGQDRLLGDEMVFWLRRDGDQYKIYRTLEDFQLP